MKDQLYDKQEFATKELEVNEPKSTKFLNYSHDKDESILARRSREMQEDNNFSPNPFDR